MPRKWRFWLILLFGENSSKFALNRKSAATNGIPLHSWNGSFAHNNWNQNVSFVWDSDSITCKHVKRMPNTREFTANSTRLLRPKFRFKESQSITLDENQAPISMMHLNKLTGLRALSMIFAVNHFFADCFHCCSLYLSHFESFEMCYFANWSR